MFPHNALLTTKEVAILEGAKTKTILKRIDRGTLIAHKIEVTGRQGFEYRIHPDKLSPKAQKRYYAEQKKALAAEDLSGIDIPDRQRNYKDLSILDLTEKQRTEAYFWEKTVREWRRYISDFPKQKTEKTKEYVEMVNAANPLKPISERTMRRKWSLWRMHGTVALADDRGLGENHKGSRIPERAQAVFQQIYLDEGQPSATHAKLLTEEWAKRNAPELLPFPTISAFYYLIKTIPVPVMKYFREGEKAFTDECLPYIQRIYENFSSNDVWSADYHTLDFFVKDDITGEVFRPHLIVWIDVRSRKVLSAYLTRSANSDGNIIAFRKAVEEHGIPNAVYLDNGREFLVSDFGGRGIRKKDPNANYGTTILERLGVELHLATVRNSKAKVAERIFRSVTDEMSRLVRTYCGGKPGQRPDRLNGILKNGEDVPLLSKIREDVETYLYGWHNEKESFARGLNGKTPNECYHEYLTVKKVAPREELDLMLQRSARLQKVKRNGVFIKVGDTEVWFYSDDLALAQGHGVFVRYNPENLQQVSVYDDQERFIAHAALAANGGYSFGNGADVEAIKENKRRQRNIKQSVKEYAKKLEAVEESPDAYDILIETASGKLARSSHENNIETLQLARLPSQEESPMAPNKNENGIDLPNIVKTLKRSTERKEAETKGEEIIIDLKKMRFNAQLNQRKGEANAV